MKEMETGTLPKVNVNQWLIHIHFGLCTDFRFLRNHQKWILCIISLKLKIKLILYCFWNIQRGFPIEPFLGLDDVRTVSRHHLLERDGKFACGIHPAVQSAIGKQQWVTGFHCVCSVVGWLIVYRLGILSLSCSQYSQTICLRGSDDNACLGVGNTSSMGLGKTPLIGCLPWYWVAQFYLQLLYRLHFGTWILPFWLLGCIRKNFWKTEILLKYATFLDVFFLCFHVQKEI